MARSADHLIKRTAAILCLGSLLSTSLYADSRSTPQLQSLPTCPSTTDPHIWEKGNNPWDNIPKDNHRIDIKRGWKIPTSNTWVTVGGMAKLDGYHDFAASSGDPFEAPYIPVQSSIADRMTNNTKLIVRQSNFNFSTISETKVGEIKSFMEIDFAANNYFGATAANRQYISLNSIGLRLREIYAEVNGFLFGQTATTFSDRESNGYTLIHNGPTGNDQLRLPMVRYTWYNPFLTPENGCSRFMVAAEASTTDYTQLNSLNPTTIGGISTIQVSQLENDIRVLPQSRGVSPTPNFTTQFRMEKKGVGHVAFRGLARYLEVRPDKSTTVKTFGWGLGFSTRLFVTEYDSIFFNYSGGKGIGHYIFDLPAQSLAYNATPSEKIYDVQFGQGIILGFEHYWTEHVRTNLIASMSQVNNARFLTILAAGRTNIPYDNTRTDQIGVYQNDVAFVNHRIQQVIVNFLYKPTAALEMGIEYNHARRTTISGQHGIAKRFQMSFIYRF